MNKQQKIKLLDKIDKDFEIFNLHKHYVYYCNKCNFKISVTDKSTPHIECQAGNYYEYKLNREKYGIKIIEDDTKINGRLWSGPADRICLNCGNIMDRNDIKKGNYCNKCKSKNIVLWKNLPGKKCPSCNGKFSIGIMFNTYDEYSKWNIDEWVEEIANAKNKYGIKEETIIKEFTEEEKRIFERENILLKYYMDQRYVLNSKYNVIRFHCHRFFHSDFYIIAEWNKINEDGYLIYCMYSCEKNEKRFISKKLDYIKIKRLIEILDKYKYFSKPNNIKRFGLDGSRWTLEIQIEERYKEIDIWTPEKGVIYDIGNLLIEYSEVNIKNLY